MTYVPVIVVLIPKHPLEEIDYPVSLDPWLDDAETATLASIDFDPGITLGTGGKLAAVSAGFLTFWLSGGTHGSTYLGQAVLSTSGSRTLVIDFSISVIDPTT
jgi:hypothetical protein